MPTLRPARVLSLLTLCAALVPAPVAAQKPPKKQRDLIAREELVQADQKFPDLLMAVMRLRPHFLAQNRGTRTTGIQPGAPGMPMCSGATRDPNCAQREVTNTVSKPIVYLDGMKFGDPDVLKGIRTTDVEEVRYLSASQAGMEYGLGHEGGAVLVKMFKGPKP